MAFAKAATYTGADAAPKMQNAMKKTMQQEAGAMPSVYAFVDGSYNVATHVYGYGGFLIHDGIKEVLQGSDKDAEMAAMRNVAGEICGSMAAIRKAVALGLPEVTIYYDYMGIEMWATGAWTVSYTHLDVYKRQLVDRSEQDMRDMETLLAKGLSEGEIRDLKRYLDQMLSNLDVDVECPKNSFCGGMKNRNTRCCG